MRYYGGKARLADKILKIVLKDRKPNQYYIEPFVGGANVIVKANGPRIGADINKYVIALYKEIQNGWTPQKISEAEFYLIKTFPDKYPDYLVGWAGVCCSFRGTWFTAYSGNGVQDYIGSSIRWFNKNTDTIKKIDFYSCDFKAVPYPNESIIYCDIPYKSTMLGYSTEKFDYDDFYLWCEFMHIVGHKIYISEYDMPLDRFKCVAEWPIAKKNKQQI